MTEHSNKLSKVLVNEYKHTQFEVFNYFASDFFYRLNENELIDFYYNFTKSFTSHLLGINLNLPIEIILLKKGTKIYQFNKEGYCLNKGN